MPFQVLIADDYPVVRHGLSAIVKGIFPDTDIFWAADFDTLLQALAERELTLLICDVNIRGCNKFQIVHTIKKIQPEIKIIIYSEYCEKLYAQRFLKAGADIYLRKDGENQRMIDAISCILSNDNSLINTLNEDADKEMDNPITSLSDRELEVVHLLVKGWGSLEICNALDLSKTTVSTYKKRIYEKMSVSTIAELIKVYRRLSGNNYLSTDADGTEFHHDG